MIKIKIKNIYSYIYGNIDFGDLQYLEDEFSFKVENYFFMPSYKKGKWDGRKRFVYKNEMNVAIPTGLIRKTINFLKESGYNYKIYDERKKFKSKNKIKYTEEGKKITLRPYQQRVVENSLKKNRGIIKVATGGGKSYIIMDIVKRLSLPSLIYVNRKDIFYQLYNDLQTNLDINIGKIGDGKLDIEKVNVVMYQSMISAIGYNKKTTKYQTKDSTRVKRRLARKLVKNYPVFILDEAHHSSSDSIWHLQKKSKNAFYRFFTTATPWREDNADIMIEAASGPKICDVTASELIRKDYLAKPYIYLLEYKIPKKYSNFSYHKAYEYGITRNSERNELILKVALKALLNKKRTLIAIKQIKHGKTLKKLLHEITPEYSDKVIFVQGGDLSEDREKALQDLNDGNVYVVIATSIFGEGVDIPNLQVLINAKAQKSSIDALQLAGRALRPGTLDSSEVMIVDIFDKKSGFRKYSKSRKKIYETEEEFEIKEVDKIEKIKEPFFSE